MNSTSAQAPSNFLLRAASGVVMVLLAVGCVAAGGLLFATLCGLCAALVWREWRTLTADFPRYFCFIGVAYAALPAIALVALRDIIPAETPRGGLMLTLWFLTVIWVFDTGCYATFKCANIFGYRGRKLAPTISPGKTWHGLLGGLAITGIYAAYAGMWFNLDAAPALLAALGAMLALLGLAGDLFESWIKRRAGVKDSGTLIPGHGGAMDRLDSLTFSAPFMAIVALIMERI